MAQDTHWDRISKKLDALQEQIDTLRREIKYLRGQQFSEQKTETFQPKFSEDELQEAYRRLKDAQKKGQESDTVDQTPVSEFKDQGQTLQEPSITTNSYDTSKDSSPKNTQTDSTFNLEEYIGGNILSKLGMLILIIGLGIFVKYAIDHNMVSPLTRVSAAYVAGAVLIGLSYWLKKKYHAYSAVLIGGGIAVLYFTTFIANNFYDLIPQLPAFAIMVLCTVFAVYQAIEYDEEVIGLIGLVGAYAVPILLGREGGNVSIMFIYMTLINAGILSVAFWKAWNRTQLAAFVISWLVFCSWVAFSYQTNQFWIAFNFNLIFFITFYITLIINQVRNKATFAEFRLVLLIINALLVYLTGLQILPADISWLDQTQFGAFTVLNAIIHTVFCVWLYRALPGDQPVKNVCSAMAVSLLTIAVAIYFSDNNQEWMTMIWFIEVALLFAFARNQQMVVLENFSYLLAILSTLSVFINLEGEWMTLVWSLELVLLFLAGSILNSRIFLWLSFAVAALSAFSIPVYFNFYWTVYLWLIQSVGLLLLARWQKSDYLENISYGVVALSIFGLVRIWFANYFSPDLEPQLSFLQNIVFLHAWVVILGLGIVGFLVFVLPQQEPDAFDPLNFVKKNPLVVFTALILILIYFTFLLEIYYYFEFLRFRDGRSYILSAQILWLLIYSGTYIAILVQISGLPLFALKFGAEVKFVIATLTLGFLVFFLVGSVRSIVPILVDGALPNPYIWLRWLLYLVVAILIISVLFKVKQTDFSKDEGFHILILGLNFAVLGGLSLELYTQLMLHAATGEAGREVASNLALKAGFDLLWGLYSLGLIAYGIAKKRKYLRLAGILLFGITLAKLFINDINYDSMINMILAFIGIGILLLIAAFLYQKYKDLIFADDEEIPKS